MDSGGISAHIPLRSAQSLPVVHGLCQLGPRGLERDCQPWVLHREAWEPPEVCSRLPAQSSTAPPEDLSQDLRILMLLLLLKPLSCQFFPRAEVGHDGDGAGWDNMSRHNLVLSLVFLPEKTSHPEPRGLCRIPNS